jgi:hypothetical protein
VANYNVEIEVALRGARELKVLKDSLKAVNKEVGSLNAATIKAGKALKGTFSAKDIANVNNYSKAVAKAERALRNAAFGTEAEKKAVKALVTAQKEFNEQLDRQNRLLKEEERLQGIKQPVPKASKAAKPVKAPKPGFQSFGISGIDFMPVGGGTNIPGSPLARQAKSQARFGSAVSAGAFPLLFGGGPGMALGGALGGAISGSTFGPAAIALQVLGGAFDQLAAQAASLGAALNPVTADVDALVESLGVVGSPIQDAIQSIEELAGEQAALEAATSQLALVVGDEGVEALTAFGDASTRFGNALTQVTTQILAQIARLTGPVVKEIATSLEISGLLSAAKASTDPRQVALQAKLAAQPVQAGAKGMPSLERVKIEKEMVEIQRKIREEEEGKLQAQVERLRAGSAERVIAENNLTIAQLDGDLTSKRVFDLEKANIFQEARQKMLKDGADIKLIELERNTKLLALENKRNDLINTATEKASKTSDRLDKQKQRAIEREIKAVDRQLERADKAFNRADEQLDKIIQKHEDKMAFEREYAELIRNGSTPAAAQQAIELKKQLLELDRNFAKQEELLQQQLKSVEFSIAKARAEGATTEALQDQIDKLEEIKNKIEGLPGKKDKAEGAIGEALAPKSDRQRVLDYMDELQGKINDMMDPVNQLISLSEAFGSAFTESFKGVVSGSMTAQEALANLFQRTADHFLDMAAQMIAAQIKMQILGIGLQLFGGAVSGGGNAINTNSLNQIESYSGVGANTDVSGLIPGKALGGAVGAGQPYLVGEKGPELFVPGAQGNIVPNNAMGGSNIVVNVDASGSSVEGDAQEQKALGAAIGAAVQAELIKQKRPGGLLF